LQRTKKVTFRYFTDKTEILRILSLAVHRIIIVADKMKMFWFHLRSSVV